MFYRGLIFLTCYEEDYLVRCEAMLSSSPPPLFLKEPATSVYRVGDLKLERKVHPKLRFISTRLHCVTAQRTEAFTFAAVEPQISLPLGLFYDALLDAKMT